MCGCGIWYILYLIPCLLIMSYVIIYISRGGIICITELTCITNLVTVCILLKVDATAYRDSNAIILN